MREADEKLKLYMPLSIYNCYTAVWTFSPVDVGNFITNYITPGARMQLSLDENGRWYNITLNVSAI